TRCTDVHHVGIPGSGPHEAHIADACIAARTDDGAHIDGVLRFPQYEVESVHRIDGGWFFGRTHRSSPSMSSKEVPERSEGACVLRVGISCVRAWRPCA